MSSSSTRTSKAASTSSKASERAVDHTKEAVTAVAVSTKDGEIKQSAAASTASFRPLVAPDPKRLKVLGAAIAHIEKQYGEGSIMALGQRKAVDVAVISSGSPGVDHALGVGGYPRGRLVEIYGPESSGKTTLALHAIAQCQAAGGIAAFVDAEHALDTTYAAALGVDLSHLVVSQPDHGEQALSIVEHLVSSGAVDLIVVDSVAALVPKVELDGEMEDQQVGLQARMMSKAMRKLTGGAHRHGVTVMFINQLRQKIGVTFGSGEVTTGGNALKFYCSVRIDIRRIGGLRDKDGIAFGNRTRVKVVKNKVAPPFRHVEVDILYGKGISVEGELIDAALKRKVFRQNGAWLKLGDEGLGQGREVVRARLAAEPELRRRVTELLRAQSRPTAGPVAQA